MCAHRGSGPHFEHSTRARASLNAALDIRGVEWKYIIPKFLWPDVLPVANHSSPENITEPHFFNPMIQSQEDTAAISDSANVIVNVVVNKSFSSVMLLMTTIKLNSDEI